MKEMKLLSTRRAADLCEVTPRTIARWCRQGKFPKAIKLGRVWRIPASYFWMEK
jgi:predicted DNA-binding transcriptional regulator AlpA